MQRVDADGEPVFDTLAQYLPEDDNNDDEIDNLFRVPAAPPPEKKARRAPPPPATAKGRTPASAPAVADNAKKRAAPPPPTSKVQPDVNPRGGDKVVAPLKIEPFHKSAEAMFPDVCDYDGLADFVYISSITHKINGKFGGSLPAGAVVSNKERLSVGVNRLWKRVKEFRKQVKAAWVQVCSDSGNTDMTRISGLMPQCKLVVHNTKSKHLAEVPVCVWSGHNTDLRSLALVPIEGTTIAIGPAKVPAQEGVMFHLQHRFVEMLKCVHTLLFLLDYVNAEIENQMSKPTPEMMGEWGPAMDAYWQRAFMPTADTPLAKLLKHVKDLLKTNCAALKNSLPAEVVAKYFVPIAMPNE
jgi:hypothetical protein